MARGDGIVDVERIAFGERGDERFAIARVVNVKGEARE